MSEMISFGIGTFRDGRGRQGFALDDVLDQDLLILADLGRGGTHVFLPGLPGIVRLPQGRPPRCEPTVVDAA